MFRRHAARLLCAVGFAATVLGAGISRAQDDATVQMARARFREGVQFYDQRQYEKARLAFLQAYALKPHPSILLNLAQSELRGGRPGDAAQHFTEYLRLNDQASEAEKQEAELGLAASKSKVGEVTIGADVSGAQITVDGEDKGTAPLPAPLFLSAGSHTIEARSGDKRATKQVNVTAGQSANVSLTLRSSAPLPTTAPAAAAAEAPESKEPEPAEKPEEEPAAEAPAEEPAQADANVHESGRGFFKWFGETPTAWIGAVIGVGGIGGSVTLSLLAKQDYSDADKLQKKILQQWEAVDLPRIPDNLKSASAPCAIPEDAKNYMSTNPVDYEKACKNYKNTVDSGDSKKTLAIVSGIVGGVALAGTIVYYFVDTSGGESGNASSSKGPRIQARLVPILAPGTSGLGIVGTF